MLLRITGLAFWGLANDGTEVTFSGEEGGASLGISVKLNVVPGNTIEAGMTCCFTLTTAGTCAVCGWEPLEELELVVLYPS